MQLRTPRAYPRDEGDFEVSVNGGNGDPFAMIDLDEQPGQLQLVMASPEECDRIVKAACAAKEMIIRQRAKAVTPHEPRLPSSGRCLDCGDGADGPLHATQEPEAAAPSEVLAASIAAGTPVIVTGDEPANPPHHVTADAPGPMCEVRDGGYICNAQDGHDGPDHVAYGCENQECHRWPVDSGTPLLVDDDEPGACYCCGEPVKGVCADCVDCAPGRVEHAPAVTR